MKIPYNGLHVSGDVIFAARGGKIHTFNLDGTHISTWKHPDVEKVDAASRAIIAQTTEPEKPVSEESPAVEAVDNDEPPAKRQKLQSTKDESKGGESEAAPETNIAEKGADGKGKGKSEKKSKNKQNNGPRNKEHHISRVPDRPVITHMTSTADGAHLLAITGHDKVIWVFEHDGKGQLTQLSQRTMPKRPSSVAIAPDSQIICADKFGDVYSLPLIFTPPSPSSKPDAAPAPVPAQTAFKPSANTTTVHSKRNLRALQNQQHQMSLASRLKNEKSTKAEPDFEHTLLLGHVSMLTSLTLGESEGRRYILTGDRDEHIRVSRYIPQAYVIEGFCFGHKEFVSKMIVPTTRGEILISGGGDEELFIWDWKASKLLSKTSILSLAQEIAPEVTKVAVSGLYSLVYPTESGSHVYILAICEDVQAVFSWQLTPENTLNHPSIIQLPGKPLDLALVPSSKDEPPKLVVAIDPTDPTKARGLTIYSLTTTDEKIATDTVKIAGDEKLEAEELDILEKEVRNLLYNIENLRKQSTEGEEAGDEEAAEGEKEMEVDASEQ